MSWNNKVIWSEGLFLRPQHFQQSDRYIERLVRRRVEALRPYPWGVTELKLNREMLALGKFAIEEARGVLEDGTPFSIPDDADHPAPFDVPEATRNSIIYLTLPGYQPGAQEAAPAEAMESSARFAIHEQEINDAVAVGRAMVGIEVGKLRLRLVLDDGDRAGLICLGLARIGEVRADKQIVLDDMFIPPTLDCAASKNLSGFLVEIHGLLHHRGEALGGRVADSGTRGVAEIADFMLLQVINKYEPLFSHLHAAQHIHPETFYTVALQLAGELATFTVASKRPPAFPHYRHDDLAATFAPLMRTIRHSLSAVLEQTAVAIPLQERKYGVHVAPIVDKTLLTTAAFVLSVAANIEAERLRRQFPAQIKLGPVENIRELVNSALPGIALRPLPVAPRQIPFHVGRAYFELDRASPHWKAMQTSGGLALHVAGDFPGLEMELWAIRGQ
jgi:type VI secretion system protein ImpJ